MPAFISYLRDDINIIDDLCFELTKHEVSIWRDREQLYPGQKWKETIHSAIENGEYFLACFSKTFKNKGRSYMREELTLAIEELRQRPQDQTWFIPISIDGTEIPKIPIGAGQYLSDIHWIDLSDNWETKIKKLAGCLTKAKKQHDHKSNSFEKLIHIAEVHEEDFLVICFIVLGGAYLCNKQQNQGMVITSGTHIKSQATEVLKKLGALEYYDKGWGRYYCTQEGMTLFRELRDHLKVNFDFFDNHIKKNSAHDFFNLIMA